MTNELQAKIITFAEEWLAKTGRETLTDSLQGYDFVEDCYRDLTENDRVQISKLLFLDILQKEINERF